MPAVQVCAATDVPVNGVISREVGDELKEGDQVLVKVLGIEATAGRMSLCRRQGGGQRPQVVGNVEVGGDRDGPLSQLRANTCQSCRVHATADNPPLGCLACQPVPRS